MISRILSRYLRVWDNGTLYLVDQNPSWDIIQEAEELKSNILRKESANFLSRNQCINILISREVLSSDYKKIITRYENGVKDMQRSLFRAHGNPTDEDTIRKKLTRIRKSLNKLLDAEASLDYICRENYEQFVLDLQIIELTTKDSGGKKVIDPPTWVIYQCMIRHQISLKDIRKMARTDPFRMHWIINKSKVFKHKPLSNSQINLASYCKMYDAVYKSMEVPPNEIIEDDDKLDGWWLIQNEERSIARTKKDLPKSEQHGEVFKVVDNKEQAQRIYDSNSAEARAIQRRRQAQMKQRGTVNLVEFDDIQQQRRMQNAAAQTR